MTDMLWLPETTPPQVTESARLTVLEQMLELGVGGIEHQGLELLEARHEPLADFLNRLGFQLNAISTEGMWPERVLKIGASLSALAYQESGYTQSVDENAIAFGSMLANIEGVPEAYVMSLYADAGLQELLGAVRETPDFARDQNGYAQVLCIGAGCTRHFMQQSLAA